MEPISDLDLILSFALALWPVWVIAIVVAVVPFFWGAADQYEEPHVCHLPPGGQPGQVWVCDCGQEWRIPKRTATGWVTAAEDDYHNGEGWGR